MTATRRYGPSWVILAGFLAVILVGVAGPKPALAATSQIKVWEDTWKGGDSNVFWHVHGGYNFTHFNTGLTNGCFNHSNGLGLNSWNDCVSSFVMTIQQGDCVRLMEDVNGGGRVLWSDDSTSGTYTFYMGSMGWADELASSVQFGHLTQRGICSWITGDFV